MVPISVDPPDESTQLRKKLGIDTPLYTDPDGAVSEAYGVWDAKTEIAIASTFVIARGGQLVYRYVGNNKADRSPIDDILAAVPTD